MAEMRPCPFCGGDGAISININSKIVFGTCYDCGARGQVVLYKDYPAEEDITKAMELWNGRVDHRSVEGDAPYKEGEYNNA